MKGNHLFIICIAIFLLLMFAIECRLPKKFVWAPSFSHYDKQPFGCAVFDSLLSTSLPKGYSLSRKTFYELEQEDTISRRGILVATNNLSLTDVDVEAILKIAKRGNKIMLVSNSFNRNLEDTLDFNSSYSYFSPALLKKYAAASLEKDTLFWIGDSAAYPRQSFYFYPQLCSSYLMPDSLPAKVLAEKGIPSVPIALSYPWGKGEIILVSTPLLFTNYGIRWKKCDLHFPPIIPNGRFTHCPHRRLHEANGPNTDVPFPVFPFSKTAEMGFVFDDVHHYPFHGIHRPKEATGNSYHLPTGKQIAGIYRTDRNSLFSKERSCRLGA